MSWKSCHGPAGRLCQVVGILVASPLAGTVMVQYDASLGQGSGSFSQPVVTVLDINGDNLPDHRLTNAFLPAVPLNQGSGAYTGPDIFGGITADALGGGDGTTTPDTTWDNRSLSAFSWRYQVVAPIAGNAHALFVLSVDTDLFPNGATLGAASWFGFSSAADGSVDAISRLESLGGVRFAVATADGQYFLSNSTVADSADGRVLDGSELSAETWQLFDPAESLDFDAAGALFATSTSDLNALGLVRFGVHLDKDSYSASRHWLEFSKFYVDAEPVPEPAGLAAAVAGLVALGLIRRDFRKPRRDFRPNPRSAGEPR